MTAKITKKRSITVSAVVQREKKNVVKKPENYLRYEITDENLDIIGAIHVRKDIAFIKGARITIKI